MRDLSPALHPFSIPVSSGREKPRGDLWPPLLSGRAGGLAAGRPAGDQGALRRASWGRGRAGAHHGDEVHDAGGVPRQRGGGAAGVPPLRPRRPPLHPLHIAHPPARPSPSTPSPSPQLAPACRCGSDTMSTKGCGGGAERRRRALSAMHGCCGRGGRTLLPRYQLHLLHLLLLQDCNQGKIQL